MTSARGRWRSRSRLPGLRPDAKLRLMSQALYRKWRPTRFDDVVGQEHVTQTLRNAVAAGRLGQAYLFCGPRGTGKTTSARLLAKAANCLHEDPAQRPDDQCRICQAINDGRFLDLIEIDAASNTGVDDIRGLRDKINFSPGDGRFKVYIIDEVHMLSTAAFNALLKTLEEPPPHAIFVLATTEEHKVPLTIKSRCQQFNFRLLTTQEIIGRLEWLAVKESLTIRPAALDLIAHHAGGSLRDAESLLDQLVTQPGDTVTLEHAQMVLGTATSAAVRDLTEAWLSADGPAGLQVIHDSLATGADPRQFCRQMVAYLRQLLLLQTAGDHLPLNIPDQQREGMQRQARRAERRALIATIKRFDEAAGVAANTWQPQLPLELAFIESLPDQANAAEMRAQSLDQSAAPASAPQSAAPQSAASAPAPQSAAPQSAASAPASQSAAPEAALAVEAGPASGVPPREGRKKKPMPAPTVEAQATPPAEAVPVTGAPAAGVAPPAPASAPAGGGLTLAAAQARWPELIQRCGAQDRNLPPLLAMCKPLGVEKNVLILGFDFPILREKFDQPENRDVVAAVLSEMLGLVCAIQTVDTVDYHPPSHTPPRVTRAEFEALADELGGVVRDP